MAKWVCSVCGYVHEGETAPEACPICKAPADKFTKQEGEMTWAAEHVVGVAQGVSEDILADLRANFEGECSEVGMYLAMARVAHREGYPEIGLYWEKAAYEEAEHAAKFAELLGEVVTDSTKKNLEMRVAAENGATAGKFDLAKRAKAANLDAIHDTVHEMARDDETKNAPRRSYCGGRKTALCTSPQAKNPASRIFFYVASCSFYLIKFRQLSTYFFLLKVLSYPLCKNSNLTFHFCSNCAKSHLSLKYFLLLYRALKLIS